MFTLCAVPCSGRLRREKSLPYTALITCSASALRPLLSSQRGDSGVPIRTMKRARPMVAELASTRRQASSAPVRSSSSPTM
ncbi:hypothetical protein D3C81_685240 [compost metagenome]